MDSAMSLRETRDVLTPGTSRQQLARTLNTAYAEGLLSQHTLVHRLDLLFGSRLIDPSGLVGDLARRVPRRAWYRTIADTIVAAARSIKPTALADPASHPRLLALDWDGAQDELLLGREGSCDVVLSIATSRAVMLGSSSETGAG